MKYYCILAKTMLVLSGCATTSTLPNTFTTDNILKVHQGMRSDEIMNLFGPPKNISQAVCGAKYGKAWVYTTWEYGRFPYARASFTFNGDNPKVLILNSFEVEKD